MFPATVRRERISVLSAAVSAATASISNTNQRVRLQPSSGGDCSADDDNGFMVGWSSWTNRQDWKAVESVQRGVESRGYVPGTLTPREDCLYYFVTRIARAYLDGVLRPQPRWSKRMMR